SAYFDIWDSQAGRSAKTLVGKTIQFGNRSLRIMGASPNRGVSLCQRCWIWGHSQLSCKARSLLCAYCNEPHASDAHQAQASCCRGNPKANPPREPTADGVGCPHPPRCRNCAGEHAASARACPFWSHRFNGDWIKNRNSQVRRSCSGRPHPQTNVI
ncbi:hypothetical protein AGABI2DRAFT_78270, partial [Agaricus bisporus var. bisporus H97]|uniref:hypothetical protein n=1 Tax=Agaricus bisporus var. bisporus (strain H97 / ATCC MYA-4626 / FGSC 10389) TaxID=936046 RepID=UPI00029F6FBB